MDSIASSGPSPVLKTALRAALEGGLVGALVAAAGCGLVEARREVALGVGAAWILSTASVSWLLWARERSLKAFWWAFGGGTALRGAGLIVLMSWSWRREGVSAEALLLSYAFGVLAMLLTMELRHFKIK